MNEHDPHDAVRMRDVSFTWTGRSPFRINVEDFSISRGEAVLLLGESGSGKSTLLSLVCGVIAPARGDVEVGETQLTHLSSGARDRFRANHIGVIFQQFNLLSYATALDNVLLALHFAPERRSRIGNPRAEAIRLTQTLGLPDSLVTDAPASALSVGQQQRVAVARALIGAPSLIVADEPTSSLDADAQASFLELLFAQVKEANSTLLMVSHDERLGAHFDRLVDLGDVARVERGQAS